MINNLPNNSFAAKESFAVKKADEPKPERVVPAASKKKLNPILRFLKDFLPDDIPKTREEIRKNIIIPTIAQTVVGCIAKFLGTSGSKIGLPGSSIVQTATRQFTSYSNAYQQQSKKETISQLKATISNYDELCWPSAADVETLINAMKNVIQTKGYVTIADLYYMGTDIVPPYTDAKWGWVDLRNAHPVRVSNGFGIDLPKAMPIDEE